MAYQFNQEAEMETNKTTEVTTVTATHEAKVSFAKKEAELNLDSFVKLGRIEKEIEPIPGFKVTMHALSQADREAMINNVDPIAGDSESSLQRIEAMKLPTIVHSITKLNAASYETAEEKIVLLNTLKKAAATTIDLLFIEYQRLFTEQYDMLVQGIKKK